VTRIVIVGHVYGRLVFSDVSEIPMRIIGRQVATDASIPQGASSVDTIASLRTCLTDLTGASWNPLVSWLRNVEALPSAA
jgi:hypothetical protein